MENAVWRSQRSRPPILEQLAKNSLRGCIEICYLIEKQRTDTTGRSINVLFWPASNTPAWQAHEGRTSAPPVPPCRGYFMQRSFLSRVPFMDEPGKNFLSGSSLTADHDRNISGRKSFKLGAHFTHSSGIAQN